MISGFLNGLSGMAGPPIAFYYLAGNETAARVRANLTTYFVFVDLVALSRLRRRATWSAGAPACRHCSWRRPSCWAACWASGCFPLASETFYRRLALVLLVAVAIGSLIL